MEKSVELFAGILFSGAHISYIIYLAGSACPYHGDHPARRESTLILLYHQAGVRQLYVLGRAVAVPCF